MNKRGIKYKKFIKQSIELARVTGPIEILIKEYPGDVNINNSLIFEMTIRTVTHSSEDENLYFDSSVEFSRLEYVQEFLILMINQKWITTEEITTSIEDLQGLTGKEK